MRRLVGFSLAALSILLLTAACGGDDDSTGSTATATEATTETDGADSTSGDASPELEDYFAQMEDIAIQAEGRLNEVSSDLNNATFDSDAEEIAANQDGLQQSGAAVETALQDMSNLDPPSEVKDAHDRFSEALSTVLQLYAALAEDIADVSTMDELNSVADGYSPDFSDANIEFDSACSALQGLADDYGITRRPPLLRLAGA